VRLAKILLTEKVTS